MAESVFQKRPRQNDRGRGCIFGMQRAKNQGLYVIEPLLSTGINR